MRIVRRRRPLGGVAAININGTTRQFLMTRPFMPMHRRSPVVRGQINRVPPFIAGNSSNGGNALARHGPSGVLPVLAGTSIFWLHHSAIRRIRCVRAALGYKISVMAAAVGNGEIANVGRLRTGRSNCGTINLTASHIDFTSPPEPERRAVMADIPIFNTPGDGGDGWIWHRRNSSAFGSRRAPFTAGKMSTFTGGRRRRATAARWWRFTGYYYGRQSDGITGTAGTRNRGTRNHRTFQEG